MRLPTSVLAACLLSAALVGCEAESSDDPVAAVTPSDAAADVAAAGVPAALFQDAAPDGAVALAEAKNGAKPGDRVVFEARVGGRRDAFVENRAIFFVTDSSLLSCDQLHGDACKTPWDYCCEGRENLLANMATVQIVGADGRPIAASIAEQHGLEPLRTVVVTGTVDQVDGASFVVNAESIHVREG